jgi:hypothetical protein
MNIKVELLIDCSWAMVYLSERKKNIRRILDTGVLQALIRHIDIDNFQSQIAIIRIINNLLIGNENEAQ